MIVKFIDAAAAAGCGTAVLLIALRVKDMPSTIEQALTPTFGIVWALLLLAGSLSAMVGSLARPHVKALALEYLGWLAMSFSVFIYGFATAIRFGLVVGLTTFGFTMALGLLTFGRWWGIHAALWKASRQEDD